MNRTDLIALTILTALALIAVLVLAMMQLPIPDVFGYVVAACVGAVTGVALPKRGAR